MRTVIADVRLGFGWQLNLKRKLRLKKATVNRYLRQWGYDRTTLRRQPPAVRFQAEYSNEECWQFDLRPSDLKEL